MVPTSDPQRLADLWNTLARTDTIAPGSFEGKSWVEEQRTRVSPDALTKLLNHLRGA